jgi:GT2 family glycosyltransferase
MEVVVNDAGSTDGTQDAIRSFAKQRGNLRLIVKKANRSAGRNIAIRAAKGNLVACVNSDTELEPDCLERLVRRLVNSPVNVGGVGGFQAKPRGWRARSIWASPRLAELTEVNHPGDGPVEVPNLPCECLVWKREALEQAGMFDEKLNWGEDPELHARMRRLGWKLLAEPEAHYNHMYKTGLREFWKQQAGYAGGARTLEKKTPGQVDEIVPPMTRLVLRAAPLAALAVLLALWVNLVLGVLIITAGVLAAAIVQSGRGLLYAIRTLDAPLLAGLLLYSTVRLAAGASGWWGAR